MFLNKVKKSITALLFSVSAITSAQNFKVVLDAGHGGRDFGAVRNNYVEKKIVLDITLKVGKLLENSKNIDVVYTRDSDEFVELRERSNIANKVKADIFVSIHANAVKNAPEAYGTETFLMGISKNKSNLEVAKNENYAITLEKDYKTSYAGYDPSNPESIIGLTLIQEQFVLQSADLANKIQTKFDNDAKRKNRGVKQGPFWVLHGAFMPSVLVEVGFISNADEGEYLNSEAGKNEIARAIASAIIEYKNVYHTSEKTNVPLNPSINKKNEEVNLVETQQKVITNSYSSNNNVEAKNIANSLVENYPIQTAEVPKTGLVFMVQIAASSKNIPTTASNFNGLEGVAMKKEDGLYKYYYSSNTKYESILSDLEFAKTKYPSAYIVAFKDGEKIPLKQALR